MATRIDEFFPNAAQPIKVKTVGDRAAGDTVLIAAHRTAALQWGKKLNVPAHLCVSPVSLRRLEGVQATALVIVATNFVHLTKQKADFLEIRFAVAADFLEVVDALQELSTDD